MKIEKYNCAKTPRMDRVLEILGEWIFWDFPLVLDRVDRFTAQEKNYGPWGHTNLCVAPKMASISTHNHILGVLGFQPSALQAMVGSFRVRPWAGGGDFTENIFDFQIHDCYRWKSRKRTEHRNPIWSSR